MKKINITLILLIIFGVTACIKYDSYRDYCVALRYIDENEQDILNDSIKIKVYFDDNGKLVNPVDITPKTRDNRKGYSSHYGDKPYYILVSTRALNDRYNVITYIKIGNYPMDTIICKYFSERSNHYAYDKIWYNRNLVWDKDINKNWLITIKK